MRSRVKLGCVGRARSKYAEFMSTELRVKMVAVDD